jgi:hypothetical protein
MNPAQRMASLVQNRRFQQTAVILHRPVFGTMSHGVQPTTFETPVPMTCIVQPASPDDLELLEEGQRLNNVQAVWSTIPLRTGNGKDYDADVLEIDGTKFTVVRALNRTRNGYYKVLAEGFVSG